MTTLEGLKTFSFGGLAFARVGSQPTGGWQRWFVEETIYDSAPVLGGTTRFTDIGGVNVSTAEFMAAFETVGERDQMLGLRGTVGMFTNGMGYSRMCLLVSATDRGSDANGLIFIANLVFQPT
jgi:hypothetical protein